MIDKSGIQLLHRSGAPLAAEIRPWRGPDPVTGQATVGYVLRINGELVRTARGPFRVFSALQSAVNFARAAGLLSVVVSWDVREEQQDLGL